MTFSDQQTNWEGLAENDPLWAVLSEPDKRGGGWDPDDFYELGEQEASDVQAELEGLGLGKCMYGKTLDLGCGPGRVTIAFAGYGEAVGYDLSPTMIGLAEAANAGFSAGATFVLNKTDDLSPFEAQTFSFVYCNRVLQHIDLDRIGNYMAEAVRVLRPGGVLWLQMLSHPTGNPPIRESGPDPEWAENGVVPHYTIAFVSMEDMVRVLIDELGLEIHQIRLVDKGEGQSLYSYEYVCVKR